VIGMASPMLQEMFAGKLLGVSATFNELTTEQKAQIATIAAAFTGLLSLFNIAGRFFWASLSDKLGRKLTYYTFFVLGIILYASAPTLGHLGLIALFVLAFGIILSMYGGGFATVPAYLADIFGTQMVGAIHGRLLTAWSVAGIIGPVLINYIREFELAHGVSKALAYDITMYILVGLLVAGLICNALVKPVDEKYCMSEAELAAELKKAHESSVIAAESAAVPAAHGFSPVVLGAWLFVGIPLAWGVWTTLLKARALF